MLPLTMCWRISLCVNHAANHAGDRAPMGRGGRGQGRWGGEGRGRGEGGRGGRGGGRGDRGMQGCRDTAGGKEIRFCTYRVAAPWISFSSCIFHIFHVFYPPLLPPTQLSAKRNVGGAGLLLPVLQPGLALLKQYVTAPAGCGGAQSAFGSVLDQAAFPRCL